jgi:hypothetical protein
MADAYRDLHFPGAPAFFDPWRWKTFRKILPFDMNVPAAAVLDDQGKRLKGYPPGDTSFVPQEIVGFAAGKITGH